MTTKHKGPRVGVVRCSTLGTTGRWDAAFNLDVVALLKENNLPETPENVRRAMRVLAEQRSTAGATAYRMRLVIGETEYAPPAPRGA